MEERENSIIPEKQTGIYPSGERGGIHSGYRKWRRCLRRSAIAIQKETGCDGVMIGRGAQGNPWIFSELLEYERTGKMPLRPSVEAIKKMMIRHAQLQMQYKGEYLGIREMRKHVSWYTSGLPNSAKLRDEINR